MAGLLSLLDLGSNAFQAQNAGVANAGRNIANINTPGYSREDVALSAALASGVTANDPTRAESPILDGRERSAAGSSGMADAQAAALSALQDDLTAPGTDVAQAVGDFFGAASRLSAAPNEDDLRQALLAKAQALTEALHSSSHAVVVAQAESNQRITDYAAQATTLAKQVADANKSIATNNDPTLRDSRDQAAKQLAQLMGGQARVDADGNMRVTAAGGIVLVDGSKASTIQTVTDPTNATNVSVQVVDGNSKIDVTNKLDGGKIAGEIGFRDGAAKQAGTDLDNLASDLANQVNGISQANAGLDGVTGRNLFTPPTGTSGAAAAFAVDPAVAANSDLLATAAPGEGQTGTGGIQALVALGQSTSVAGGGVRSFADQGIKILGDVGSAAASASNNQNAQAAAVSSLASLRDSVSGVSQEDELSKLAQFQRAGEAATKFVSTVNDMLDNMITNL